MSDWLDPAERALLDADQPPGLPAGFADRVAAQIGVQPLPEPRTRRDRRGAWRHSRMILFASISAGLVSVAAASSLVLGVPIRNMPVIGALVESVAPAPKPKPKTLAAPKPVKGYASPAPSTPAPVALPVIEAEPVQTELKLAPDVRREAVAERIADRLEKRAERRRALGLPPAPLPPEAREKLRERFKALPPEERKAVIERVRSIRQDQRRARRAERGPPPIELSEEQREQMRQRREERRRLREARGEFLPPAAVSPPVTPQPITSPPQDEP